MVGSNIILTLALCLSLGACASEIADPSADEAAAAESLGEFELVQIARGKRMPASNDVRIQAIEVLGARNAPGSGQALARLLVPHERLAIRQAVAEALQTISCEDVCIESVLDYLERRARGELGVEEWLAAQHDESARAAAEARESELYYSLERVLRTNSTATLAVLVDHYGIDTMLGSEFAVKLVGELRFEEACPAMLKARGMFDSSPVAEAPAALVEAIEACGC
jgi:hypothetical protein